LFTCTYVDENGHFPILSEVIVDGEVFSLNPLSFDYSSNVIFESNTGSYGWDEATFRFSDNNFEFIEETIINNSSSDDELPIANSTLRNYPNPFNPSTTISFETINLHENAQIDIYNLKGQKVKTLDCSNSLAATSKELTHSIVWGGTDSNNQSVSSGIYFYKLIVDNKIVAGKKMLLIK